VKIKFHVHLANFLILLAWAVAWTLIFYVTFRLPMVPRFEDERLNYATFIILVLAPPFSLLWITFKCFNGLFKWLLFVVSVFLAVPTGIASLFALDDLSYFINHGVDESFKKIDELETEGNFYRLYRTNGGATTAYGLVVRQEHPLYFGLKLKRNVVSFDAYEGKLTQVSPRKIRLHFVGNDHKQKTFDIEPT
jgi:hypothetical protein